MGSRSEVTSTTATPPAARSRRSMLAAIAGGLGAAVAAAMGRPAPSQATHASFVQLAHRNPASGTTDFFIRTAGSFRGPAVVGRTYGLESGSGSLGGIHGLAGTSMTGMGLYAESIESHGLLGITHAANRIGVYGRTDHEGGTAVFGQNRNASTSGALGGRVGVFAQSAKGVALEVQGGASFSTAGRAVIPQGATSVSVFPEGGVPRGSKILCTLQADAGEGVTIRYAARNREGTGFTIVLTGPTEKATGAAWFVLA